jgi:hypothetical protein
VRDSGPFLAQRRKVAKERKGNSTSFFLALLCAFAALREEWRPTRSPTRRYNVGVSVAPQGHRRIERRSLELHRAIAAKLRAHPDLIWIAHDNLDRWSAQGGRSQPYWDAWREILNRPLPEVLELLEEDSERMAALRQATPFAGVLDPAERWAVYDRFDVVR